MLADGLDARVRDGVEGDLALGVGLAGGDGLAALLDGELEAGEVHGLGLALDLLRAGEDQLAGGGVGVGEYKDDVVSGHFGLGLINNLVVLDRVDKIGLSYDLLECHNYLVLGLVVGNSTSDTIRFTYMVSKGLLAFGSEALKIVDNLLKVNRLTLSYRLGYSSGNTITAQVYIKRLPIKLFVLSLLGVELDLAFVLRICNGEVIRAIGNRRL